MDETKELITLVIHTPERAGILKGILESHGVKVVLEDFIVSHSTLRMAERVKISESDLPIALKIIESGDGYSASSIALKMAGMSGNMLIPVDFSESSLLSVKMGFSLSKRLSVHPVVMHSFVAPLFSPVGEAEEDVTGDTAEVIDATINTVRAVNTLRENATDRMAAFRRKILDLQKSGDIPDLKFSTTVMEGVPEDVILNYCEQNPPMLVVMATRGVEKKEEDLVGSVTAEVLDSCRVPVLTVPDNHKDIDIKDIKRLMMFCNIDQHDVLAMDTLMRMFDFPEYEVILVPAVEKRKGNLESRLRDLTNFFNSNFPNSKFTNIIPDCKNVREEIDTIVVEKDIQMMIVPNKKKNIFSRIFHPTIAHKFIFERDMLMLALPV